MVDQDLPDYIHAPFTDRLIRAYRFSAYPVALCVGGVLWTSFAGEPLSRRLIALLPAAWLLCSIAAIDAYMTCWRRRARRIFVEGRTVSAVMVGYNPKLCIAT
jgi:hypothetical protein